MLSRKRLVYLIMSTKRFQAIQQGQARPNQAVDTSELRSSIFGANVFSQHTMKHYVSKSAYDSILRAVSKGDKISRDTADAVANGMKLWALSKGATHYTHWFQPLTGATAEKHDAFFEVNLDGSVLEKFDGNQLVQQEPDASSFPHGGIRNTFEARGYTAWDPTSPAFIYGATLCIPTVFVSYTGEALDYKTPLLKALQVMDQAATEVAQYFDKSVNKVSATLGWEQEFFLVDKALAGARTDISLTGRTLLGHAAAKDQQLDDHYFGSIPLRVLNFLKELEYEALLVGIPVKTRHNEVGPNQFEIAPIFEEANLAVDHNTLLMDLMERVAEKHYFKVLLHEKPFKGINGSGKHNNWSLATDSGVNLLSPGKTPMKNLQFLTFFINTIKAVYIHQDLLRASIASAGNDLRLGDNEAPPNIISVFIGKQLTSVLDELEKVTDGKLSPQEKTDLKLNVIGKIPAILLDNTDRNRTSPFAFTGNKFEFRGVGASANCAHPMTILNVIVAQQLLSFKKEVDLLIDTKDMKKDDAIFNVLREYIKDSKKVRFEGDGYNISWEKEAAKRGLGKSSHALEALQYRIATPSVTLFESLQIMNARELQARYDIAIEGYVKKLQIESRVLGDLIRNEILPAAISYQNTLIANIKGMVQIYGEKKYLAFAKAQQQLLQQLSEHISQLYELVLEMIEARKKANALALDKKALAYNNKVLPYFASIRKHSDKLELLIEDALWPLPKYHELLFTS